MSYDNSKISIPHGNTPSATVNNQQYLINRTMGGNIPYGHPLSQNVHSQPHLNRVMQPPPQDNQVITTNKIRELLHQIDPNENLEPEVETLLLEIAEDFIESVTTFACSLSQHRNSSVLEVKDVKLHVERNWNIHIPGYQQEIEGKPTKKSSGMDHHKQRLELVRKSKVPKRA